jgi:prephenate dehydrogenase
MIERVFIAGTGLIGASIGFALREAGFAGEIVGTGPTEATLKHARQMGAIDRFVLRDGAETEAAKADLVLLAGPVLAIEDWMQRLAPVLGERTLVTDVGSTKAQIAALGAKMFNQPGRARFLPGHPMAGKESGGAALAEASLFRGAMWLFTPQPGVAATEIEAEWRAWVAKFGAHDELVAWVSHLPQMLSTALASLLEETFADAAGREEIAAIGGRALRETTRLGASPYSMWRDIALTNSEPIAATLHALEQKLAHLRENLRTPELKEEFRLANEFRARK